MPKGDYGNIADDYPAVPEQVRSSPPARPHARDNPGGCNPPAFARRIPARCRHRAFMESIMNAKIRRFFAEEDGVTALEYGLLAAVVAGALVVVAGPALRDFFTALFAQLTAAVTAAFA